MYKRQERAHVNEVWCGDSSVGPYLKTEDGKKHKVYVIALIDDASRYIVEMCIRDRDGIDSSKDAGKLMISVLSAVAEIERENIGTQTMAGREQKAREGKWNGGFAPYGYKPVSYTHLQTLLIQQNAFRALSSISNDSD